MTVWEMQEAILCWGWQFQEHIFNDGHFNNCYVKLTKDKNPHALSEFSADTVGWGRFERQHAWEQAYEHVERKEQEHAAGKRAEEADQERT